MNDLDFVALLVSRVCHDLVSPVGAVVNGLEVLEDETDADMRADALRLVAASAEQAAARLQFARIAFGAAGSAGAELDLAEVGRITSGFLSGGKVELSWNVDSVNWPKNWAKLLMNAILAAADCMPRGGRLTVESSTSAPELGFRVVGTGSVVRQMPDSERVLSGESPGTWDGRAIQSYLTYRLAKSLDAKLSVTSSPGEIVFAAGKA